MLNDDKKRKNLYDSGIVATTSFSRFQLWAIALGLFLMAAFPRVWLSTTSRFTDDEALFWVEAKHIAEGKDLPVLGPSVSGGKLRHPGATFYYVMAVSQWVSPTPESANAWIALLNAAAIVLFWLSLRASFGELPAFLTATLYCFSPWSLLYADRIWNGNLLNAIVIVALWAAMRVRQDPASRAIAILILAAGIYPQFHLSAPVVWVALWCLVAKTRKSWNRKWLVAGLSLLALAYAPYFIHEVRTGFSNFWAYFEDGRGSHWRWSFIRVPLYAFRFLTLDVTFHELMGYWGEFKEITAIKTLLQGTVEHPFSLLRFLATLASFFFAGWAVLTSFQKRAAPDRFKDFRLAILTGLAVNMLLLAVAKKLFYAHYIQFFLPFFFLIYARFLQVAQKDPEKWRWCLLLCAVFCVGGLETSVSLSHGLDARNGVAVERQVLQSILADPALSRALTQKPTMGIAFGFRGGSKLAYQALLEEVFHQKFLIVSPPGEVNYLILPSKSGRPGKGLGPVILIPGIQG